MALKYTYEKALSMYMDALNERSEPESEWRQISEYLVPGRGIYQNYSKPRKKKLSSPKVINTAGEDSLTVLTSGMHSALTSPSRPWFKLEWADEKLNKIDELKIWMQKAEISLHRLLHSSNFYSILEGFYTELGAFGNGCVYAGEDTYDDNVAFRFELLTAGEYAFSMGANGKLNTFYRTIFMTPYNFVARFPNASPEVKRAVADNKSGIHTKYITVLELVIQEPYDGKDFTRMYYEITSAAPAGSNHRSTQKPLEVSGFHEHPYGIGRWMTIGSDEYGVGPGSRSLSDIKRLQEMEKAFLMATHKSINPPLNVPARMKGKLNTLPGGDNYYMNPNEMIKEVYRVNFDYQGVSMAIERVEKRIQRNFYNDVFITASRDPNASPLKARQVEEISTDKMIRMGPIVSRLGNEFFLPLIERCFNIAMRKEFFEPLSSSAASRIEESGGYNISLVSPLATAQRAVALQSTQQFLGFVGQAAQFDRRALDNIDIDEAVRDMADITGVRLGILASEDDVKRIREARAAAEQQERQKQEQAAMAQGASQVNVEQANAAKLQSEANLNLIEAQQANV